MSGSSAAEKPIDLGNGEACASFDPRTAAWLSIGTTHQAHGFVELNALPAFDERQRGDPTATRRHRLDMTLADHAFLSVEIDGARPRLVADLRDVARPAWAGDGSRVEAMTRVGGGVIRQDWAIGPGAGRRSVRVILRGSLDRPALAEITETDPPPPTNARTSWRVAGDTAHVDAPALPAAGWVRVRNASWAAWDGTLAATVPWPPEGSSLELVIEVSLGGGGDTIGPARDRLTDRLTDRALAYIRGCTTLRVAADERVMLTDHRILPLSWTRDAYWQALALLAADGPGDRQRVADHLRWLWRRCERPDGRWVRSHHANGRRKDLAFQADQQLYPIVELADHWRLSGELPDGVAWEREVPVAWNAAMEAMDGQLGLIGSTENAADDPAAAPFIGSSQILLWYAANRLAELADAGLAGMDGDDLRATGFAVRRAFDAHIAAGGGPWAYAIDGAGTRVAYHDANDLPLALAPAWGFCASDDSGWRATMAFGFSPTNPGWFGGSRAGLGSIHTPGPWTLGDVQHWLHARASEDPAGVAAALDRLQAVAFVDGMLPEAYGADDDVRIRHWFAWPGAALAALRQLDGAGLLEKRLSAGRRR